jgi:hypothetical protein
LNKDGALSAERAGGEGDLVRVVAKHFTAGLILDSVGVYVVRAAPILRWIVGHRRDYLTVVFKEKGWKATIIKKGTPS